ncbi:MAG: hypothetical protein NTY11_02415 [Candidatus Parcubacteria bacterium]|nr:hypothetical protein [Candidatus Parcubacteria bacterium]
MTRQVSAANTRERVFAIIKRIFPDYKGEVSYGLRISFGGLEATPLQWGELWTAVEMAFLVEISIEEWNVVESVGNLCRVVDQLLANGRISRRRVEDEVMGIVGGVIGDECTREKVEEQLQSIDSRPSMCRELSERVEDRFCLQGLQSRIRRLTFQEMVDLLVAELEPA